LKIRVRSDARQRSPEHGLSSQEHCLAPAATCVLGWVVLK